MNILHRPGKLGLGTAYRPRLRYAIEHGYDLVFEMDADFSHDPKYLPDFLRPRTQRADLVIGSRYIPGGGTPNWSPLRRFISGGGTLRAHRPGHPRPRLHQRLSLLRTAALTR